MFVKSLHQISLSSIFLVSSHARLGTLQGFRKQLFNSIHWLSNYNYLSKDNDSILCPQTNQMNSDVPHHHRWVLNFLCMTPSGSLLPSKCRWQEVCQVAQRTVMSITVRGCSKCIREVQHEVVHGKSSWAYRQMFMHQYSLLIKTLTCHVFADCFLCLPPVALCRMSNLFVQKDVVSSSATCVMGWYSKKILPCTCITVWRMMDTQNSFDLNRWGMTWNYPLQMANKRPHRSSAVWNMVQRCAVWGWNVFEVETSSILSSLEDSLMKAMFWNLIYYTILQLCNLPDVSMAPQ